MTEREKNRDEKVLFELNKQRDINKCFAMRDNGKCKCLNVKMCIGITCTTRKTIPEIEEQKKMTYKRLSSLGPKKQVYISEKYYAGKMPWRESNDSH